MNKWKPYQQITTSAKKVGGPIQLVAIILASGYCIGKLVEVTAKECKKNIKRNRKEKEEKTYIAKSGGEFSGGVKIKKGDKIKILNEIEDGFLIAIEGDKNNPFVVSKDFFESCFDL